LVILSALTALGVLIVLPSSSGSSWPSSSSCREWAERVVEIGAGFLPFVLVWLLFPAALSATVGLFLTPSPRRWSAPLSKLPPPRKQALLTHLGRRETGRLLLARTSSSADYFVPF
jgi:hypothetical protein